MNPLFNPNREREAKSGLEKHRKLLEYGSSAYSPNKISNIPNDWFYNEQQAAKNWEDLEHYIPRPREEKNDQHNNFAKIERQSELIRNIIENFEMSDAEFITHIMEIIDSEVEYSDVSEQEFLLDAKVKLSELLNSHQLNGTDQTNLLTSLHNWFKMVKQDLIVLEETDAKEQIFDASVLIQIVNDSFENQEKQAEKAMIYHRNIVDQLSSDIRELTKTVNIQKEEIDQLKEAMMKSSRSKKKDSSRSNTRLLKKIAEQEYKINSLKESISNAKNEAMKSNSTTPTKNLSDNEEEEKIIDEKSERILVLEQNVKELNAQIKQAQTDNQNLSQQLYKLRSNEITSESKIASLERQRNALDAQLKSMSEKSASVDDYYKKEMANLRDQIIKEISPDQQLRELNIKHQNDIAAMREQLKKQFDQSAEKIELKYRTQMNQLVKAIDSGEKQGAAKIINDVNEQKIQQLKAEYDSYVQQLKDTHNSQISSLTKYYEMSIKKEQENTKSQERKFEREKENVLNQQKWQIEEENTKSKLQMQTEFEENLSNFKKQTQEIRASYDAKLHELQQLNNKYLQIIKENELEDEIPGQNSEEKISLDMNKIDSVIDASMKAMRANEIEKGITERLNILLESQRNEIDQYRKWQEESAVAEGYKNCRGEINNLRANLMIALSDYKTDVDKGIVTPENTEKLMLKIIELVKGSEDEVNKNDYKGTVLPVSEVDFRFAQVNNQVIGLTNENKVLTMMLSKFGNSDDAMSTKDVIDKLVKSASEIEEKHKQSLKENEKLQKIIENLQKTKEKVDVEIDNTVEKLDATAQCVIDLISFDMMTTIKPKEYKDAETQKDKNVTPLVHGAAKTRPRKSVIAISPNFMICEFQPAQKPKIELETECETCHQKFDVDPAIFDLASSVDPVVECPHCHSSHTISSKSTSRTSNTPKDISAREKEIVAGVKELIDMKKLMRANSTKNTPTLPISAINQINNSARNKLERTNSMKSTTNSARSSSSQEIDPAITITTSRPSTPKVKIVLPEVPYLALSDTTSFEMNFVHAFTVPPTESDFTPEQVKEISDKEKEINQKIDELIDLKSRHESPRIQTCDISTSTTIELTDESTNTVPVASPVKLSPKHSKVEIKLEPRRSSIIEPKEEEKQEEEREIILSYYDCDSIYLKPIPIKRAKLDIIKQSISYEIFMKPNKLSLIYNSEQSVEKIKLPKSKSVYGPQELPLVRASLTISSEAFTNMSILEEPKLALSTDNFSLDKLEQQSSFSKFSTGLSILNEGTTQHEFSGSIAASTLPKVNEDEKANEKPQEEEKVDEVENKEFVLPDDSVIIKKDDLIKMKDDNESLKTMHTEMSNFVQDLVARHQEIVEYLVGAFTKSTQEDGKKNDEFAAQLAIAIKEREMALQEAQSLNTQLQKKTQEAQDLNSKLTDKDAQIIDIMNDNSNLKAAVEKVTAETDDKNRSIEIYNAADKEQREHLDSLTKAMENETMQKSEFQKELSKAKIEIERLLAKLQYYESEKAVDLAVVTPFLIFSTEQIHELPHKGFGLSPSGQYIDSSSESTATTTSSVPEKLQEKPKTPKTPDLLRKAATIIQTSVTLTKPKDTQAKLIQPKSRNSALRSPKLPNFSTLVPMKTPQGTLQYTSLNKGSTGYYERNGVEYKPVHERVINNMKVRLDNLDILLQQKANEVNEALDAKQRLLVQIQKLTQENIQLSRDLRKLNSIHDSTRTRLGNALNVIEEKEEEIKNLRRIIAELQKSANTIVKETQKADASQSAVTRAEDRAERARRAVAELQEAYKGTAALRRFAQRQILAIARWEAQRKEMIENERRHTMSVLAAMGFISIQTEDQDKSPVKIKNMSSVVRTSHAQTRPSTSKNTPSQPRRSTAPGSKNILKQGVVAIPLSVK